MIQSPILKVLSSFRNHQVRALLMGGQACIFYGAAEFSRDTDLAVLSSKDNLKRLKDALAELKAECIAVPPFDEDYLKRGHAIHFRCRAAGVEGMRVDIMSVMRNADPFSELWKRRTTVTDERGTAYEIISLPDLVQVKKTQRDKDWPMIRRLVEAHYFQWNKEAEAVQLNFWFRELRTPELLIELAQAHPEVCESAARERGLLRLARPGPAEPLARALENEEKAEKDEDRLYWQPLKAELEKLRRK